MEVISLFLQTISIVEYQWLMTGSDDNRGEQHVDSRHAKYRFTISINRISLIMFHNFTD